MKCLINIILIIFTFTTCEKTDCQIADREFVDLFEKHLDVILKSRYAKEGSLDSLTSAFLFVEAITGIEPRFVDYDTPHYLNKSEFREDMALWKDWLDKNKCTMTYAKADSLLKTKGVYY